MWMVVRIPAGDITNLHYNFVVAKPLVLIKIWNVSVVLIVFVCMKLSEEKGLDWENINPEYYEVILNISTL